MNIAQVIKMTHYYSIISIISDGENVWFLHLLKTSLFQSRTERTLQYAAGCAQSGILKTLFSYRLMTEAALQISSLLLTAIIHLIMQMQTLSKPNLKS